MSDWVDLLFDFFENIVGMMEQLRRFLFQNVTIGTRTFQPFYLIVGGTFTAMLIAWFIGKVIGWVT